MTPHRLPRLVARALLLVALSLAARGPALAQPPVPDTPELTPEARARLSAAAEDARLAPWQREVMQDLARGTGAPAGSAAAGADVARPAFAAGGEDGAWTGDGTRPIARAHPTPVYDPARGRMLVFGGDDNNRARYGDVWALSLEGEPAWTRLAPTGTPPTGRSGHSAIYDPVRDRMIVFGGSDGAGVLDEVWALSLPGTPAWTRLTPAGVPAGARASHSAIYDPVGDRMVIFGGHDVGSYLNDVRALSLGGAPAWTQLASAGTPPVTRWGHSAIYDPARGRMVVFGGYVMGGQETQDVWALSLAGAPVWTQLAPTGTPPSGRCEHSAVYDPVRDRMVLFGGVNPFLNDAWALSLEGTPAWTKLTTVGTPPGERASHGAIYDPVRDRMVVFAGVGSSFGPLADTWALTMATLAWTRLAPPPARAFHSAIHDPVRDRMLVFGGNDGFVYMNDVWALSLAEPAAWTLLTPTGTPPAGRSSCSAIYDPVRDRLVFFAGNSPSNVLTEVWALSLAGMPAWTQLAPLGTPPTGRFFFSAIHDPVRDRMLVFGGSTPSVYLNDVWALSLAGTPTWTQLAPTGTPPSVRYEHSAIYDPLRDRMLVFGGSASGLGYFNDAWALSLAGTPAWTQLLPTGTPPGVRRLHGALYDPVRDRMVVFGGYSSGTYLKDLWALSLAGTPGWAPLAPGGTSPNARCGHSAIYDPLRDRMAIFGGRDSAYTYHDDIAWLTWGSPATPVMASLESVQADPDGVRLAWLVTAGSGAPATVYRSVARGPWEAVDQLAPDGSGRMVYEDRAVAPGTRYGYRLGIVGQAGEVVAGETWVDVPRAFGLALAGVRPNPAVRDLAVTFTLPDGAPARLELFDLAGRRVAAREVGALGGGEHVVRLADGRALAPGVYAVRLTQGRCTLTRRAVIVR